MNTFITSILRWKKDNRKDKSDMNNTKNVYDDGNIPEVDLPKDAGITHAQNNTQNGTQNGTNSNAQNKESDSHYCTDRVVTPAEPLPESTRPRKDGPGGD